MRFHAVIFPALLVLLCPLAIAEDETPSKTFPVKASQGVAVDANHFYAISNTKITKHDKTTSAQIATWEANPKDPAQAHFKHMNSATVIDGKLYAAHSRFPIAPNENTVEIFSLDEKNPTHQSTIRMPGEHGSLTWIDRKNDGSWWMCFAVYGKPDNKKTKLVKYRFEYGTFTEQQTWIFPEETVAKWGTMSCSGGSWGDDGKLYVTGHDHAEVHVLEIDSNQALRHIRTQSVTGICGQAIAWDRSVEKPSLWGIVKNKHVSLSQIPTRR
jgi:outer membrane protein assembly factor BamB